MEYSLHVNKSFMIEISNMAMEVVDCIILYMRDTDADISSTFAAVGNVDIILIGSYLRDGGLRR